MKLVKALALADLGYCIISPEEVPSSFRQIILYIFTSNVLGTEGS